MTEHLYMMTDKGDNCVFQLKFLKVGIKFTTLVFTFKLSESLTLEKLTVSQNIWGGSGEGPGGWRSFCLTKRKCFPIRLIRLFFHCLHCMWHSTSACTKFSSVSSNTEKRYFLQFLINILQNIYFLLAYTKHSKSMNAVSKCNLQFYFPQNYVSFFYEKIYIFLRCYNGHLLHLKFSEGPTLKRLQARGKIPM